MSDALADRINRNLPLWARYEGYGTYALYALLFSMAMLAATAVATFFWSTTAAFIFAGAGLLGVMFTRYYKSAAKLRVECQNCGRPAKGKNKCPYCGSLTYLQGENA